MDTPSTEEIDAELSLAITGYDPNDKYPEWGNSSMREAYLAGWEEGRRGGRPVEHDAHCERDVAHGWHGCDCQGRRAAGVSDLT